MSELSMLSRIYDESKTEYENAGGHDCFSMRDSFYSTENIVALGDNLSFMKWLLADGCGRESIDFIYADPPFFSGSSYDASVDVGSGSVKLSSVKTNAYNDRWQDGLRGFLMMLTPRLMAMRELLAHDGLIAVHLDWHAVHYVKVLMDELFGGENFVNELVWVYKSGGASGRSFARKHDTILLYSKSKDYYFKPSKEVSYNRGLKPYGFKGVQEYKDEKGWYTLVNRKDVLNVDMVGRTSGERTGYATQKPRELISVLLESCAKPGALCADFFSGSGTLAATAAEAEGRRFICCDSSPVSFVTTARRLLKAGVGFCTFTNDGDRFCGGEMQVEVALADGRVRLLSYVSPVKPLPVAAKDLPEIEALCRSNKTCLVALWAVDRSYDGQVFKPSSLAFSPCTALETTEIPHHRIAIKAWDVFGGSAITVVEQ